MADKPRWLTPAQASKRLGVAVKTLANWRSRGVGPSYRRREFGRPRIAYCLSELQRWQASVTTTGSDPVDRLGERLRRAMAAAADDKGGSQ